MGTITSYDDIETVASDDVIVIVDVSDNTQSSSGSTKKATVSELSDSISDSISGSLGNLASMNADAITKDINITGDSSSGILSDTPRVSWGVETSGNSNAHGEINSPSGGVAYLDFTTVGVDYQMRQGWFDTQQLFEWQSPDGTVMTLDQSGNLILTGALTSNGATFTADAVQNGSGQFVCNGANSAQMRLGQKSNTEMVWSYNVNQNNDDSIDDASLGAWKFSIEAGGDYTGAHFQYSGPGSSWDGSTVFTLDGSGNVEIFGDLTVDGSNNISTTPDTPFGTMTTAVTSEQTLSITQNDYLQITWGESQNAAGLTADTAGTFTVVTAGVYFFQSDLTIKRTATGLELALGFFVNDSEVTEIIGGYGLTTNNTQYHFSGNFASSLNVGDVVSVQATLTDADGTLVVTDAQFTGIGWV